MPASCVAFLAHQWCRRLPVPCWSAVMVKLQDLAGRWYLAVQTDLSCLVLQWKSTIARRTATCTHMQSSLCLCMRGPSSSYAPDLGAREARNDVYRLRCRMSYKAIHRPCEHPLLQGGARVCPFPCSAESDWQICQDPHAQAVYPSHRSQNATVKSRTA